jgi:hypothetical protein
MSVVPAGLLRRFEQFQKSDASSPVEMGEAKGRVRQLEARLRDAR